MARGRARKTGSDNPDQPVMADIVDQNVEQGEAADVPANAEQPSQAELLDRVFREPSTKQGLRFFRRGERAKLRFRLDNDGKVQIRCLKRNAWLRAKPEEVVRQAFLVWIQETLGYPMVRVGVEWPIQMGEDAEKERADIVVFTDDARTDPFIVFELKRPDSKEGLEQLRSYLRWTGCFFGCWSDGSNFSFQLKEEHHAT